MTRNIIQTGFKHCQLVFHAFFPRRIALKDHLETLVDCTGQTSFSTSGASSILAHVASNLLFAACCASSDLPGNLRRLAIAKLLA
jgi:hypothetical protein